MKKEVTIYVCDRCGCEYNGNQTGWYEVDDGEYAFIGDVLQLWRWLKIRIVPQMHR